MLIVNSHLSLSNFIRHKDILIEDARHGGGALVDAAPSLYVASFGLSFTDNEIDGLFTDDQHLLVLHLVRVVVSVEGSLDVVLHLGLGLLTGVLMFEVKRGGDVVGQLSHELNRVDAWVQHTSLNIKHSVLVLKELLFVLQFLMALNPTCVIAFAFALLPEADERVLFSTFDFKLNVRGLDSLSDLNVNETLHSVSGFIERVSGLELDVTLGELAPRV